LTNKGGQKMIKEYVWAAVLATYLLCGSAQAEEPLEENSVEKQDTKGRNAKEPEQKKGAAFIEVMGGYSASTLDAIVHVEVVDGLTLTARGRIEISYPTDGAASVEPFVLGSARFNIVDNLSLRFEGYCLSSGCRPSVGLEYGGSIGDLNLFGFVDVGLQPNVDVEGVLIASYTPTIKNDFGLRFAVETYTNLGTDGHHFSGQRIRAGVCKDTFCVSAAADLLEVGNEGTLHYNVGAAVSVGL
jgi:hypothetical protein